tara:strand:+ start:6420 stop:7868 length:1449 start_codon:yes stop_codon:yes gene_type:complete
MSMTDKEDSVSSDRIPDLIKIGAIPTTYGQTIHTDVIDPVTFDQRRCRFTLQRVAGFLHSNSKITMAVTPLTSTNSFYPLNIGVSNLIQSATLRIGNKTVCEIDDYCNFHQYQSLFITNENNKEREQFLSQRCINHQAIYEDASVAGATPNSAPTVGLDTGRNPVVAAAGGQGAFELLPFQKHDATSAQTIADAPVYSVYLSDLFPFLKYNQLPCFMLDEEVHIDLTFTDETSSLAAAGNSRRMCVDNANAANLAVSYLITEGEVKLIYDSISYDGEIMRKYAEQNKKLTFQYVDYRLAKRTGATGAFTNLVFPIGGNGRLVSKVMFGMDAGKNFTPVSLLNGVVASDVPAAETLSINLLYNDLYEFNRDRVNPALLFHTTQHAEGMTPMVARDEYQTSSVSALTTDTFEGYSQNDDTSGLRGLSRWTAIKPNKGQRVNNKGIDLVYKSSAMPGAVNYTLRAYLELVKTATIENGEFNCYFA